MGDVTATLDLALAASGLDHVTVVYRSRLWSENGASYLSADLAEWLDGKGMQHVRGAPCHPQTQGKIERRHQTLKNRKRCAAATVRCEPASVRVTLRLGSMRVGNCAASAVLSNARHRR